MAKHLSPKYTKVKGKDMTVTIIVVEEGNRTEIDHILQIGLTDHHLEEKHSFDKSLGEETEETLRTTDLIEVGVDLDISSLLVISEKIKKVIISQG